MQREIKFRTYSDASKNMTEWDLLKNLHAATFIGVNSTAFHLMQYTGLRDKNGKEIYEGDVVISKELNAHAEVRYGNAHFFIVGGTAAQPLVRAGWELSTSADDIEVIGNIYETPNLLK